MPEALCFDLMYVNLLSGPTCQPTSHAAQEMDTPGLPLGRPDTENPMLNARLCELEANTAEVELFKPQCRSLTRDDLGRSALETLKM